MNYRQQSILYLAYLLVYSDGEYDDSEKLAIDYIRLKEGISDNDYQAFLIKASNLSERVLYDSGVAFIEECSPSDKLDVFSWLYKLSEADGTVHAKEVRFLLYSLRKAGIDFEDVKAASALLEGIPPD